MGQDWVDVQLMRGFNYFYDDPVVRRPRAARFGDRPRPAAGRGAGAETKGRFLHSDWVPTAAAKRFMVDDEVIGFFLDAWRVVVEAGLEDDIETNFVRAGVGYFRLIQGDVVTGQEIFEAVVALAAARGDRSMELTCLPCLAWARLRQHDVAGARALARQSAGPDIALPFPFPEMARAVLAWVAWKEDRYSQVEELAGEVLETNACRRTSLSVRLHLPLASHRRPLGRRAHGRCHNSFARELLQPPQLQLPPQLEESLADAVAAWKADEPALASERLRESVVLAERLNFA